MRVVKVKLAYIVYLIAIISIALVVNGGIASDNTIPATQSSQNDIQDDDQSVSQNVIQNETFLEAQSIKQNFISTETEGTGSSWLDYRIVAHALGSIDGHRATNSFEAMAVNYTKNNMRVFEADMILTSDDRLVLRHDWLAYLYNLLGQTSSKGKESVPLTYQEFMSLYSFGKYEPMDIDALVSVLDKHKDIFVITDTKYTDPETISKQFRILVDSVSKVDSSIIDRLVIQIYNQQMYDLVIDIYPFKNIIYAVYANLDSQNQIIEFCKEKGIEVVAIPIEKVNPQFIERLNENDIKVYVHTVNIEEEKDNYKNMGAWGIYSDYLTDTW